MRNPSNKINSNEFNYVPFVIPLLIISLNFQNNFDDVLILKIYDILFNSFVACFRYLFDVELRKIMIGRIRLKNLVFFLIGYFIQCIKASEQELKSDQNRLNSALNINVNRSVENNGFHRLVFATKNLIQIVL